MPIPTPKPNEAEGSFMSRCIRFVVDEGTPQEQAIAICSSQYRKEKLKVMTWKTIDRKRASYSKYAKSQFSRALKAHANEYLDQVEQSGLSAEYTINRAPIENAMYNVYSRVMTQFASDTYSDLSKRANKTEVNWGEWVARWFQTNTTHLIDGITNHSQLGLAKLAQLAVKEGWSIREYQKNASQLFEVSERRAELIGRTEIIRASNAGSLMGAQETGFPMMKYWLATRDNRTRGTNPKDIFDHYSMDEDKGILLDQPFNVSGENLQHPGDIAGSPGNTINCRCTLVYQVVDTPQGQVIEETVEPTEFDFDNRVALEKEWHESYSWANDKEIQRIVYKTRPLNSVDYGDKGAYHLGNKINMNGYRPNQLKAKRTWHHEYGHQIDYQFEDYFAFRDEIYNKLDDSVKSQISRSQFGVSNLAMREATIDYENISKRKKQYLALREEKDNLFFTYSEEAESFISRGRIGSDLEELFKNDVISFDDLLTSNGMTRIEFDDVIASLSELDENTKKRIVRRFIKSIDQVKDSLKTSYTQGIDSLNFSRVLITDDDARKLIKKRFGREFYDRLEYYNFDEATNFKDFFGSLTINRHGLEGHSTRYYRTASSGLEIGAYNNAKILDSHLFEAFANHIQLRSSDISPVHLKLMNHFFPNVQNKFYHIVNVLDEFDTMAIHSAMSAQNFERAGELLAKLLSAMNKSDIPESFSRPLINNLLSRNIKFSKMSPNNITPGYIDFRTKPEFLDKFAELLLFSPESYFIVEGFKSIISVAKYKKMLKYIDTLIQNRESADKDTVDDILNLYPIKGARY